MHCLLKEYMNQGIRSTFIDHLLSTMYSEAVGSGEKDFFSVYGFRMEIFHLLLDVCVEGCLGSHFLTEHQEMTP